MDFETFTSGRAASSLTPVQIAKETAGILAGEGYLGEVNVSHGFHCREFQGVQFWSIFIRMQIAKHTMHMELYPRHLWLSVDEFVKQILLPHLEPLMFRAPSEMHEVSHG